MEHYDSDEEFTKKINQINKENKLNKFYDIVGETIETEDGSKRVIREAFLQDVEDENDPEEIENLMEQGYSEEHAEEVAMLNNYNIPLEDMFDYNYWFKGWWITCI